MNISSIKAGKDFIVKAAKVMSIFFKKRKDRIYTRFRDYFWNSLTLKLLHTSALVAFYCKGHEPKLDEYLNIVLYALVNASSIVCILLLCGAFFKEFDLFMKDAEANNWEVPHE